VLIGQRSPSTSGVKEVACSNHHNQSDGDNNRSRIDIGGTLLVSRLLIGRAAVTF